MIVDQGISLNPSYQFRKFCTTETRITAQNALELIKEDLTFEEIRRDYYLDLEIEEIKSFAGRTKNDD